MCVCVCPRIDPLRFLAGSRRRRLNQGLVVALDSLSVLDRAYIVSSGTLNLTKPKPKPPMLHRLRRIFIGGGGSITPSPFVTNISVELG